MTRPPDAPARTPIAGVPVGRLTTWVVVILTAGLIVAVSIDVRRPYGDELPRGRDAGAFAYAGWAITQGQVPYRDFWDHKPPGIHYVNAVGLTLADGEFEGVRYVETAFVIAALLATWALSSRAVGSVPAAFGTMWLAIFASHPVFRETENLTETWSSLLAAVAFAMLLAGRARQAGAVIAGALLGAAVLFKPVAVAGAIGCAVFCALAPVQNRGARIRSLVGLIAGGTISIGVVTIYLVVVGAGREFWAQTITFNFVYVSERAGLSLNEHFGKFVSRTATIHAAIGIAVAVAFWALAARFARRHRELRTERSAALAAGAWSVLATVLAASPGKYNGHYFLELLPPLAFLLMVAVKLALGSCRRRSRSAVAIASIGALLFLGLLQYRQHFAPARHTRHLKRHDFVATAVADLRQRNLLPGKLLIWGADSAVYFAVRSPSPTRCNYYYPLLSAEYAAKYGLIDEFVSQLNANPPDFIVDFSPLIDRPAVAIQPPAERTDAVSARRDYLAPFFQWVESRYAPIADPPRFGRDAERIPIYERVADSDDNVLEATP